MFRKLYLLGVNLFLVSAAWPMLREEALMALASARVIESQAYLLLANRAGFDLYGQKFAGKSGIFSPFGIIKVAKTNKQSAIVGYIHKKNIVKARKMLPTLIQRILGIDYD